MAMPASLVWMQQSLRVTAHWQKKAGEAGEVGNESYKDCAEPEDVIVILVAAMCPLRTM